MTAWIVRMSDKKQEKFLSRWEAQLLHFLKLSVHLKTMPNLNFLSTIAFCIPVILFVSFVGYKAQVFFSLSDVYESYWSSLRVISLFSVLAGAICFIIGTFYE